MRRLATAITLALSLGLFASGTGFADAGNITPCLHGAALPVLHINDYPDLPAREQIDDSHRVYPGDGTAPLARILRDLRETGFRGVISLELFNRDYWKQDAATVLRTGLTRMRTVVRASL